MDIVQNIPSTTLVACKRCKVVMNKPEVAKAFKDSEFVQAWCVVCNNECLMEQVIETREVRP